MYDKKTFYDYIRAELFGGRLLKDQVAGMERILDYQVEKYLYMSFDELAYVLATVYHETGKSMQPVLERGSQRYLRKKKYWPYIGTGLIQVTWKQNYDKFGFKIPQDGLDWDKALHALFYGMINGLYTGKRLVDYFNTRTGDHPVQARRIVNGIDQAARIASVYAIFREALYLADAVANPQEGDQTTTPTVPSQPDTTTSGQTAGPTKPDLGTNLPPVELTPVEDINGLDVPFTSDLKKNVESMPETLKKVPQETPQEEKKEE